MWVPRSQGSALIRDRVQVAGNRLLETGDGCGAGIGLPPVTTGEPEEALPRIRDTGVWRSGSG